MATLDAANSSGGGGGPLAKKSLRSKRLMRPASNKQTSNESIPPMPPMDTPVASTITKTDDPPALIETPLSSANTAYADDQSMHPPKITDDSEYQVSVTDTETLTAGAASRLSTASNTSSRSRASSHQRERKKSVASSLGNDTDEFVEARAAMSPPTARPRTVSFGSVTSDKQKRGRLDTDDKEEDDDEEEEEAKIMDFENVDLATARQQEDVEKLPVSRKSSNASYNPFDAYGYVAPGEEQADPVTDGLPKHDAFSSMADVFGSAHASHENGNSENENHKDNDVFGGNRSRSVSNVFENDADAKDVTLTTTQANDQDEQEPSIDMDTPRSDIYAEQTAELPGEDAKHGSENADDAPHNEIAELANQDAAEETHQRTIASDLNQKSHTTSPTLHKSPTIDEASLESMHAKLSSHMTETANGSGNNAREYPLGRSTSMRYGTASSGGGNGGNGGNGGRRRPSLSSSGTSSSKGKNRRSIMLTSFVPPVGMSGGPSSTSSPPRLSGESQADGLSPDTGGEITISSRTAKRMSTVDTQHAHGAAGDAGVAAIRLRPSSEVSSLSQADSVQTQETAVDVRTSAKSALQSISERIGSAVGVIREEPQAPEWLKEVQRRKREAREKEEAEARQRKEAAEQSRAVAPPPSVDPPPPVAKDSDEDLPLTDVDLGSSGGGSEAAVAWPAAAAAVDKPLPKPDGTPARSIYRSLSASLGIGSAAAAASPAATRDSTGSATGSAQSGPPLATVPERQRATSQSASSPATAQSGIFAAVSSFFGRTSTAQAQAPPPTSSSVSSSGGGGGGDSNGGSGTIAFPGMRPSQSDAAAGGDAAMDVLLHQLEAQNQQILQDNKARVFAHTAADADAEAGDGADDGADWDFWGSLLNDYERVSKSEPRKLARSVHSGIPKAIRGTVWQLMSGARSDPALGAAFARLAAQPVDGGDEAAVRTDKQIRHDLARTFPRHEYFRDAGGAGQQGLYAVLRAYALYDAEVGYCQGLAFVVGPLLLNMPDGEAFAVLARLMFTYGLRGHFLPAMDDLRLRLFQFEHVLRDTLPRLARHFEQQGVEPTMYVSQWLMTLFAYRLPMELTFRLFDTVFAEGLDALLRVAIAVLRRSQTRLLSLQFEAILHYLNDGPLFAFYAHAAPDMLVRDANQVTAVTPRMLERLRRRYIDELARRLDEEDELARLRSENEAMRVEARQQQAAARQLHDDAQRQRAENMRLQKLVAELEDRLEASPAVSQPPLPPPVDDALAQKNVQLAIKNQQLEDSLQDMEAALIQIKLLYAESENQKDVLAKKFEDLRRALT